MALYYDQSHDFREDENRGLMPTVDLTMETCVLLAKIYRNGFTVDTEALEDVCVEFETEKLSLIRDLNESIISLMGDTPINLNSPEQLSWVIYSRKPKNKTQWANEVDPYMSPTDFKRFINCLLYTSPSPRD